MNITVIGSGYVGLVSGTCFAELGNNVLCMDIDHDKISILEQSGITIYEPALKEMMLRNITAGRLKFTSDVKKSVEHGDIQFIAVGTPPDEDGSADMQHVIAAARDIGKYMNGYKVIVNKSTVPVGTAAKVFSVVSEELKLRNAHHLYSVVSNPEFLREGAAIDDFMTPSRIVLGSDDATATNIMKTLYAPFQRNCDRILVTDTKSAELIKYAANAMLATRISFMNELANLSEKLGTDIESIRLGIGSDPRIGYDFLYPGCGYGGSCFPKDIQALIRTAKSEANMDMKLLSAVEEINNYQKTVLLRKIIHVFGDIKGKHFALWGLAFKPDTDDMREAPSRQIIQDLLNNEASVTAYDPVATDEAKKIFGSENKIRYASNAISALQNADALIIVTEWEEFNGVNFAQIKSMLKTPYVFDGRNLYNPQIIKTAGLVYHSIGRSL